MSDEIEKIKNHLKVDLGKELPIEIICEISGITFDISTKDIMGSVIQEWFGNYLKEKNIVWTTPDNTQQYPDFILSDNHYLEVKTFNSEASPGFDIANAKSFFDSVYSNPARLLSDCIIFEYSFEPQKRIANWHLMKIWEITSLSKSGAAGGLLGCQVKRGTLYNIRPFDFRKSGSKIGSLENFIYESGRLIDRFSSQLIDASCAYSDSEEWTANVRSSLILKQT